MDRRILATVLAMMMVAGCVVLYTSPASNADEYSEGDKVTVPVVVTANPGFNIMEFYVTFDKDSFSFEEASVENNDFAGQTYEIMGTTVVTPGKLKVMVSESSTAPTNITGTGKLLDVTFTVKAGATVGEKTFGFSYEDDGYASNASEEDVNVEGAVPSDITIEASPATGYSAGDDVTVPVVITQNPGFNIMEFYVVYDSDSLTYKSVTVENNDFAGQTYEIMGTTVVTPGKLRSWFPKAVPPLQTSPEQGSCWMSPSL